MWFYWMILWYLTGAASIVGAVYIEYKLENMNKFDVDEFDFKLVGMCVLVSILGPIIIIPLALIILDDYKTTLDKLTKKAVIRLVKKFGGNIK